SSGGIGLGAAVVRVKSGTSSSERTTPRTRPASADFSFNVSVTTEIYTLSLHDALPIFGKDGVVTVEEGKGLTMDIEYKEGMEFRSEEHTSELQSQSNLVCRLLLEKKNQDSPGRARVLGHGLLQCLSPCLQSERRAGQGA